MFQVCSIPDQSRHDGVLTLDEDVLRGPHADPPAVHVLPEYVLRLGRLGFHADILQIPFPVQLQRDFPSVALGDDLGQIAPAAHALAVDGQDVVPCPYARHLRGGARLDAADVRREARNPHHENDGKCKDGEEEIKQRPRHDNGNLLQDVLLDERALLILREHVIGIRLPEQLDIAPQGHEGNHVLGFADFPADQLRAKPQGELEDPDAQVLGQEEVTQLVNENQNAQQNDYRNDVDTDTHPNLTLFLFS